MIEISTESLIAQQPTSAMTILIRNSLIQSVNQAKDALNGTLAIARRMMAASERSIAKRKVMMSSATSCSIAVMELKNAPKARSMTLTTRRDKKNALHSINAPSLITEIAQLVKSALFSKLR